MKEYSHSNKTGIETVREWIAPGGVAVVARRDRDSGNQWRIEAGPDNLIGRTFRHIRDARIAVKHA